MRVLRSALSMILPVILVFSFISCAFDPYEDSAYTLKPSTVTVEVRDEPEYRISTSSLMSVDVLFTHLSGTAQTKRWTAAAPQTLSFTTLNAGNHLIRVMEINSESGTNCYETSLFTEPGSNYNVVIRTGGIINVTFSNAQNPPSAESCYCLWAETIPISCKWDNDTRLDIWKAWDGNLQIAEDRTEPGEGQMSWTITGTGVWMGMGIRRDPLTNLIDLRAYSNGSLQFLFKGTKAVKIGIKSGGNTAVERWVTPGTLQYFGLRLDDKWHEVCVPITAFAGVDLSRIEQVFMLAADSGMGYSSNSVYHLDRIFWSKTAPVSIQTNTDWTVMVYLDADNNLETYGLDDLNEMEAARIAGSGVRVIVLADRTPGYSTSDGDWKNTRLYEILQDPAGPNQALVSTRLTGMGLTSTGNEELNMGDPATLRNFVQYVMQNYPSSHFALVLWNHGGGWKSDIDIQDKPTTAVAWDNSSGGDCLTMPEVKTALLSALGGKKLDVIGFDACLMAMAEVAYQLKDTADVLVASEEIEWAPGWDYSALLESFAASRRDTYDFTRSVIDTYATYYDKCRLAVTISAINLTKMDTYLSDLNAFVTNTLMKTPRESLYLKRTNSLSFYRPAYVDLCSFAGQFVGDVFADRFLSTVQMLTLHEYSSPYFYNAYGLSTYFPRTTADSEYNDYLAGTIDYIGASKWDEFLKYFLGN